MEVTVADDEAAVPELVSLIDRAYARGEAGLWRGRADRAGEAEIASAVRAGHMLVASVGGRIAGCLRTRAVNAVVSDLGLIGVDPAGWGGGTGRALVTAAEDRARARGTSTMRLELPVPRTGTHPDKKRLSEWYTRRGYAVVDRIPMENYLPPRRATPRRAGGHPALREAPLHQLRGARPPYAREEVRGPGPLTRANR